MGQALAGCDASGIESVVEAAVDAPLAWNAVCSGGLRVLSEVAALSADRKREHLWSDCDLLRLRWFSKEEWLTAEGSVVVALAGAHAAADAGIRSAHVRALARALAGIGEGAPAEDPLLDRFIEFEPPQPVAPAPVDSGNGGGGGGGGGTFSGLRGGRSGSGAPPAAKPRFDHRVEPTWSKRAARKGGSCTVQVFVTRDGALRNLEFIDGESALQGDVRAAVEASSLTPRTKAGRRAAGRFKAVFHVDEGGL